jgi:hypothetical protein
MIKDRMNEVDVVVRSFLSSWYQYSHVVIMLLITILIVRSEHYYGGHYCPMKMTIDGESRCFVSVSYHTITGFYLSELNPFI